MEKSEELKAIEKIVSQVEKFNEMLGGKADAKELAELKTMLNEAKTLISALQKAVDPKAENELSKLMTDINKRIEDFAVQIGEIQKDVDLSKKGDNHSKPRKNFLAECEEFVKATFEGNRKTKNEATIRIKAAEIFAIPSFFEGAEGTVRDAFTGRFVDPTLYQRKRKTNLILDWFTISTINVPKLLYLVKEEVSGDDHSDEDTGGAEWITSGATKPMRSFRVTTGEVEAKKVAIFGTIEDKLLRDVPSLENWVQQDFFDEMREAYNDALLNNDPDVDDTAPLGLKEKAVQYVGSSAFTNTVPNATVIDVIVAMAADMATRREQPSVAFVSNDLWYSMQILKDSQARYQNNPLVYTNSLGEMYIAGVRVVGVDVEDIPSTHILMIGADVGFQIRNYADLVFERGLNADDFRHDRTSYRGYQEVLSYVPTHRENSVMYDSIANVLADIEATS